MIKGIARAFRKLPLLIPWLAGVSFTLILCLLVIWEGSLSFSFRNGAIARNAVLFPFAALLIGLCLLASRLWKSKSNSVLRPAQHPVLLLCVIHGILFLLQWILLRGVWFYAGWDVTPVQRAAMELASGLPLSDVDYFSLCPNNAPLAFLLSVPYWIGLRLGMAVPYIMLPISGMLCVNLASLLGALCVLRLTRSRRATAFAFVLSTFFILFSPFGAIPYSDVFSILFPVLGLFLWLSNLKSPLKWFLLSLCAAMGTAIKATVAIWMLALLLFSGMRCLASLPWNRKAFLHWALIVVVIVAGWLPGIALQRAACTRLAGEATPEGQLSMSHYLMMGLNQDSYGGHSPQDVAFSQSFATLTERQNANIERAWQRLISMDLSKAASFFSIKLYKAYNSGTFAWNGSFLPVEIPRRSDALSGFLRSIYYSGGAHNAAFVSVYQTVWLGILTLCACAFFLGRRAYPYLPLLGLTLLGVCAYLALFECWPRYLFLYAPFFVICATLGLRELAARQKKTELGAIARFFGF